MNRCCHNRLKGRVHHPSNPAPEQLLGHLCPWSAGAVRSNAGEAGGPLPQGDGAQASRPRLYKSRRRGKAGQGQQSAEFEQIGAAAASATSTAADGAGERASPLPASWVLAPKDPFLLRAGCLGPLAPHAARPFSRRASSAQEPLAGRGPGSQGAHYGRCSLCPCAPVTTAGARGRLHPPHAPRSRRRRACAGAAGDRGAHGGQRRPAGSADPLPRPTQTRSVPPARDPFLPPSQAFAAVPLFPLGGKPAPEGVWREVTATLAFILGGAQFCLRG